MNLARPIRAPGPIPSTDDVVSGAHEVWSVVLGLDLEPRPDAAVPFPRIDGIVLLSGAWEGAVLLSCSEPLGRIATEAMFGTDDVLAEDILDAIGELTNMVGGSVKSLLPAPTDLSIPSVAHRDGPGDPVPGMSQIGETVLESAAERVSISIWQA